MADKVVIDRRWCLTEDKSRVVEENDPAARWLWAIPGHIVDRAEAERLGALEPEADAEPPKRKPGQPPGSGTKKAEPAEDKSVTPEENKGGLTITARTRRA
jgi:hypothetical protein